MRRMKKPEWVQKCDVDKLNLPVPTQIVSNEEFAPPEQSEEQSKVERRLIEIADISSKKLGISRRRFLASTGGMAAAFLAMNSVFGDFFNVSAEEVFEPFATDEKFPKKPFILLFDGPRVDGPSCRFP